MRKIVRHIINCFTRKPKRFSVVRRDMDNLELLVDKSIQNNYRHPEPVEGDGFNYILNIRLKQILNSKKKLILWMTVSKKNALGKLRAQTLKKTQPHFDKLNVTTFFHNSFRIKNWFVRLAHYDKSVFVVFSKQRFALMSVYLMAGMLFFASCEKGHRTDCFKGTGEMITENKAIEIPFDTIKTNGRIRVNLIQDSLNYLEISTGENLVDGIEFNVVNNTLTIEDHIKCNWVRRLDHVPLVTIHYTTLHYFSAGNYFDNYFLTVHKGEYIYLDYWTGSGITHFNGDVDEAYFVVNAGSGGFEAAGHARFCYMYHAGGSRWNMSGFDAPEVYVNTLSNNDVHVRCDSLLWCDIRRTGNIYYSGNPSQIIRNGMGSGQIIHE